MRRLLIKILKRKYDYYTITYNGQITDYVFNIK